MKRQPKGTSTGGQFTATTHGEPTGTSSQRSLSLDEAARSLGCTTTTMRRFCAEGRVSAFLDTEDWRVPQGEIDRILAERDLMSVRLANRLTPPVRTMGHFTLRQEPEDGRGYSLWAECDGENESENPVLAGTSYRMYCGLPSSAPEDMATYVNEANEEAAEELRLVREAYRDAL